MNLQLLQQVREEVASMPYFDMTNASCCIAGVCNRITRFSAGYSPEVDRWSRQQAAAEQALEITPQQGAVLFYSIQWPEHVKAMGYRNGALYLLDGLILSEQMHRVPKVIESQQPALV